MSRKIKGLHAFACNPFFVFSNGFSDFPTRPRNIHLSFAIAQCAITQRMTPLLPHQITVQGAVYGVPHKILNCFLCIILQFSAGTASASSARNWAK